ncbi:recombination protein RecR [Candidatus Giovannonibacteria bacterium RIFCSPHIGHO2_01_FULL_48_47]|nr:MAG: recombination protein RecR [Candidatus Giovannonibacteria bacterium RIFCSPHIGHO2_01_FULL_48_47]OGF67929.1 MAG: recombination protein RecR [Candidatus Giovannonibacteria bacterium RIFCSPHIGHO2_02_FULL_48_15]OGF88888.1 MAG: recombination protein RecR [Candidatus Giovannonibacteria bacterium RIFCSPLOWO2_01_FULL_48_47]OGF95251.1 MAG: recombination protein RecR [Candidatus Giovannonibacteria bacterium RIFOXYC1_FULL_48_8]OGF96055.1 MAG: recombination protein RecR [Candidatus Giovannonibacteri
MSESIIHKLVEYFERLPGIGPRQARRFVYALVEEDRKFLKDFAELISKLNEEVSRCGKCFRIFSGKSTLCGICQSSSRDDSKLLVVEKDADLENLEKNQIYEGKYFVLGGLLSPLKPEKKEKLRLKELKTKLEISDEIKEVILALSATTEGDMTRRFIEELLEGFAKKRKIKITNLARGLSTGTELEYSDRDTLKHALENRK